MKGLRAGVGILGVLTDPGPRTARRPIRELTRTFLTLLQDFRGAFTQPSFVTFVVVLTGWGLSHRHRDVPERIQSRGATPSGHHSRYHRFFSHARWSLDTRGVLLASLLVRTFAPVGLLEVALDDPLGRKRGRTLYGVGMHHDPLIASRAKPLVSWGHDGGVLCLVLRCPFWAPTKVWSRPVRFRLYKNRPGLTKGQKGHKPKADPHHRTRPERARELLAVFAAWFADRQILASADSA